MRLLRLHGTRARTRLGIALCAACLASIGTAAPALAAPIHADITAASVTHIPTPEEAHQFMTRLFHVAAMLPVVAKATPSLLPDRAVPSVRLIDAQTNEATPQGDATLKGAKICAFDAEGHLVANMETDEHGVASLSAVALLGAGTYHIACSKAPAGYANNLRWGKDVTVTDDNKIDQAEDLTCPLSPLAASMIFAVVDADTEKAEPQGDATLEGAEFTVTNKSANPVWYAGTTHEPGEVVTTVATGTDGECTLPEDLAYGTYEATNTKAPCGYTLDGSYAQEVTVDGTHSVLDATGSGKVRDKGTGPVEDAGPARLRLIYGGITVTKADADTGETKPAGAASLKGATFEISYAGTKPVKVKDTEISSGQVALTVTTDEKGVATTDQSILPYGRWTIRETTAPEGYLTDQHFSGQVTIDADGLTAKVTCQDQVMRGDLTFHKVTLAGAPLAQVAFKISSDTTGESHIAVTDDAGHLFTSSKDRPHTKETNGNDQALKEDGTLDEAALDHGRGIWFSGSKDASSEADDSRGALPFDTYTLEELPSSANAGLRLRTLHVRVDADGTCQDLGSVADEPRESLATRLAVTSVNSDGTVKLTDEVTCDGLVAGATYTLMATLHVRGDQGTDAGPLTDAVGKPFEASVTFEATDRHMEVLVPIMVERSAMADKVVVCFEELRDAGGTPVATHADIADDAQTARIAHIETTLTSDANLHAADPTEKVSLTDRVFYEGLETGATYTLTATLVDRDSGDALTDDEGKPLAFTHDFVAEAPSGMTAVRMTVDARGWEGRSLVCYERLERSGVLVTSHEDPNDEEQTMHFCKISTVAHSDGGKATPAIADAMIIDTVTYENLVPGQCHFLKATLADKETGLEIPFATGTIYFIPEKPSGTVEVQIAFDATDYAGRSVVVKETLMDFMSEAVLATHADINDPDQTIRVIGLDTYATSDEDTKYVRAVEDACILDQVTYTGVEPGEHLLVSGTLVNAETGVALTDDQGDTLAFDTVFVAEGSEGQITNEFHFDARGLAGQTLVCTEELYTADFEILADHYDLTDEDQMVKVIGLSTMLADEEGTDQMGYAAGKRTLTDLVRYEGLETGVSHTLVGSLFDRETEQMVSDEDGVPYMATTTFTPQSPDGLATVTFEVDGDGLKGTDVVAFEQLFTDGDAKLVASHADLGDPSQTVSYPNMDTQATCAGTHTVEVAGDEDTFTITDEIYYTHVAAGLPYTVEGYLVDTATGEAIEGIAGTSEFIAPDTFGFVDVTFEVPANKVKGRSVCCMEYLYQDDVLIAAHADAADTYQQVTFMNETTSYIDTCFHAPDSTAHEVKASASTDIVDTIEIDNLEPGVTYQISTRVIDAYTGHALPLIGDKGTTNEADRDVFVEGKTYHFDRTCPNVLDASALKHSTLAKVKDSDLTVCEREREGELAYVHTETFTAKEATEGIDVHVRLDTSKLAGSEIVCFERIERDGQVVAVHEDVYDDDQTVEVIADDKPVTSVSKSTTPASSQTTTTTAGGSSKPLAHTGDDSVGSLALLIGGLGLGICALAMRDFLKSERQTS